MQWYYRTLDSWRAVMRDAGLGARTEGWRQPDTVAADDLRARKT
jgi:hypothetical protein